MIRSGGGQFSEPGYVLILVAILFSFQIYCDFSGYSDIAIGCAKLFGIKLTNNFNYPYFSRNIKEFWRRWHISLMTWLRDYIYYPLGGSRCSTIKIYRNILIVWIISGLWHGPNWTFICWGLYHALLIILYRIFSNKDSSVSESSKQFSIISLVRVVITFILVSFGWILFRAESLQNACLYIIKMLSNPVGIDNALESLDVLQVKIVVPSILLLLIVEGLNRRSEHGLCVPKNSFLCRYTTARYSLYIVLALITFAFSGGHSEFLYFRF